MSLFNAAKRRARKRLELAHIADGIMRDIYNSAHKDGKMTVASQAHAVRGQLALLIHLCDGVQSQDTIT